jgi:hypothetical protein
MAFPVVKPERGQQNVMNVLLLDLQTLLMQAWAVQRQRYIGFGGVAAKTNIPSYILPELPIL